MRNLLGLLFVQAVLFGGFLNLLGKLDEVVFALNGYPFLGLWIKNHTAINNELSGQRVSVNGLRLAGLKQHTQHLWVIGKVLFHVSADVVVESRITGECRHFHFVQELLDSSLN